MKKFGLILLCTLCLHAFSSAFAVKELPYSSVDSSELEEYLVTKNVDTEHFYQVLAESEALQQGGEAILAINQESGEIYDLTQAIKELDQEYKVLTFEEFCSDHHKQVRPYLYGHFDMDIVDSALLVGTLLSAVSMLGQVLTRSLSNFFVWTALAGAGLGMAFVVKAGTKNGLSYQYRILHDNVVSLQNDINTLCDSSNN
ncbi:MAG: hypothetical protein OXC40_07395 [Proteobacteria bacterium]|nr:hypothetical protein [Pseudomonadota bacterium]